MATAYSNFSIDGDNKIQEFLPDQRFPNRKLTNKFSPRRFLSIYTDIDFASSNYPEQSKRLRAFITNVGRYESSQLRGREERGFNQSFIDDPKLTPFVVANPTIRGLTSSSQIFPSQVGANYQTQTRDDGFVAIGTLLFYVSTVVSYSETARNYLNARAGRGIKIPKILQEKLFMVRRARPGGYRITPNVFDAIPDSFLKGISCKDSVLDTEWLCGLDGINWILSLFARMHRQSGCYVNFVDFQDPIEFDSGFSSTFTSLSSVRISKYDGSEIGLTRVLLPNAYGQNSVNGVHLIDTYLTGAALYMNGDMFDIEGQSFDFQDITLLQDKSLLLYERGIGLITNKNSHRSNSSRDGGSHNRGRSQNYRTPAQPQSQSQPQDGQDNPALGTHGPTVDAQHQSMISNTRGTQPRIDSLVLSIKELAQGLNSVIGQIRNLEHNSKDARILAGAFSTS